MKDLKRLLIPAATVMLLAIALPALASGGEGHADSGKLMTDFFWRMLNFAVTFGILAYFLTKPLRNGLAGRREGIAKSLEEAEAAKAAAEAKFAEYDAKLNRAEAEIDAIAAEIKLEGEKERERIIAQAKEMAEKIRVEAERSADFEVARAQAELRAEAARLAVSLAQELLEKSFTAQDQSRLLDEYMKKVGELH
jgi:F-type H+-transporting ATPase subunit b